MPESKIAQTQPAMPQQPAGEDQAAKPGEHSLTDFTAATEQEWLEMYWRRRHAQTRQFPLGDR